MSSIFDKFKKFDETIFFKSHSELEDRINYLKKLNTKNDKQKLALKLCEIGLQGEKEIEYELKHCDIGMYVLHDVHLEYNNDKAQIDYILITPGFMYFIECKNLIGNITIDSTGQFIREYSYDSKFTKESIYSPLTQAQKHIDLFKKIWKSKHNALKYKIINKDLDKTFKPLVVMTNPKNLLDIKCAPLEIKKYVVRSDELVNYIKEDINCYSRDLLSSKKEMYVNAYNIMLNYHKDLKIDYNKFFKSLEEDFINKFGLKNTK